MKWLKKEIQIQCLMPESGAVCTMAAVEGGWMNVMINMSGLKDKAMAEKIKAEANALLAEAKVQKEKIVALVISKM
jgi:formiminotetrahydrofolate cyclodeaminase